MRPELSFSFVCVLFHVICRSVAVCVCLCVSSINVGYFFLLSGTSVRYFYAYLCGCVWVFVSRCLLSLSLSFKNTLNFFFHSKCPKKKEENLKKEHTKQEKCHSFISSPKLIQVYRCKNHHKIS